MQKPPYGGFFVGGRHSGEIFKYEGLQKFWRFIHIKSLKKLIMYTYFFVKNIDIAF